VEMIRIILSLGVVSVVLTRKLGEDDIPRGSDLPKTVDKGVQVLI